MNFFKYLLFILAILVGGLFIATQLPNGVALQKPQSATNQLITKKSAIAFGPTVRGIVKNIKDKELTLFRIVPHSGLAKNAELKLPPTVVIIFGNPKMGTKLMQSNRKIGLDLPLKILVWQDRKIVNISYLSAKALQQRYGIKDADALFETMGKALDGLTTFPKSN